jgi:hypothetical protein
MSSQSIASEKKTNPNFSNNDKEASFSSRRLGDKTAPNGYLIEIEAYLTIFSHSACMAFMNDHYRYIRFDGDLQLKRVCSAQSG